MTVASAPAMAYTPPDIRDRTFAFACEIVQLYRALIATKGFPFGIARQLLQAGTSIGANLEEARAGASRRDSTNKWVIALKEARETKYWLRLIRATALAPAVSLEALLDESDQLVAILTVSVRRMREG